jgi:methylmalonyl-CoA/ethylmalonyl-CoA epimerase
MADHPLDHVAIAVPSIRDALPRYQHLLGLASSEIEEVPSQNVAVAFLGGPVPLELLEPRGEGGVARFLERRGPGLHHIAYRVPDLEAELARLSAAGARLIDERPREGARGHKVAFVHPEAVGGVLVELVQG